MRVITKGKSYISLFFFKIPMDGYFQYIFYNNSIDAEGNFNSKTPPSGLLWLAKLIKEASMYGYLDFNENNLGAHVYSKNNPPSCDVDLDGEISAQEKKLNFSSDDDEWIAVYGPNGALVGRINFPDLTQWFFMNEDLEKSHKPEENKGELAVGWTIPAKGAQDLIDITKIQGAGTFTFSLYFFPAGFKPPMEIPALNIKDHPVKVSCAKFR